MKEIVGARVVENREVAQGSRWLVVEPDEALPDRYEPGNIVAVYVPDPLGSWVRHPYTVSWSDGARVGVLYRVIPGGRTTPTLARMAPGETLRLGGCFGEPVRRLVPPDAPSFVGVSTGTGIGPLYGFASVALAEGFERPLTVLAGFREAADVAFAPELDRLAATHANFSWMPVLSRPASGWRGVSGRVGAHVGACARPEAHWHLVGNGAMIVDVRAGLLSGGVPATRITTETYFNRGLPADPAVVAAIALGIGRPPTPRLA